ncbi:MAG: isochorismatase family protein [Bacteriovoracia bacterium]
MKSFVQIAAMAFLLLSSASHAAPGHPRVGIVVIDVQKSFFAAAANENMAEVTANTKKVFELAKKNKTPFFITYEGKKTGDHDIPETLRRVLPKHGKSFIKTTYAATGLKPFVKAIKDSGVTHLVVLGSETDVCVMHTVLGLRKMGYQVSLQKDAVFSSEHSPGAAYRRMEMAGVHMADMPEVAKMMESDTPPAPTVQNIDTLLQPMRGGKPNLALVLNLFDEAHIKGSGDSFKAPKLERIRELLLLAEWTKIPVYVKGVSPHAPLPESLKKIMPKDALRIFEQKKWHSFADFPPGGFQQVLLAGSEQNLNEVVGALGKERQLFLTEDSLLSSARKPILETEELVPLTYKSLYFGLTQSISQKEWPVKEWIDRDPTFYPLMSPAEQLLPMKPAKRAAPPRTSSGEPALLPATSAQ